MKSIVWTKDFSVGVTMLDEQHKRLVSTLNKLIQNPGAGTRSETVADILTELTNYAQEHFKSEEELMVKLGYPNYDDHKKEHLAFTERVAEMCMATVEGSETVPHQLLDYLHHWLHNNGLRCWTLHPFPD